MMRVVLDTNVVASALLWGGKPLQLLQAGRQRRIQLHTSTSLLTELTNILARPKFAPKIAAARMSLDELTDQYAKLTTRVRPEPIARVVERDPDDDHVIACAIAARADAIVSGDKDLLVLGRYAGIPILTVREALGLIG
jgi:putative PIN family toxin of toxin-antitoxin system